MTSEKHVETFGAYTIREMQETEYGFLNEFLYQAIFIPEGVPPPPRAVIRQEALQVYVKDFGTKKDDKCFVAEVAGQLVGAVWVRIMHDYGHVRDDTPSFAISLCKDYRGFGIGTELMKTMLACLKKAGYPQCSLAVQKANYAVGLYRKVGFEIVSENSEEYIMLCRLN